MPVIYEGDAFPTLKDFKHALRDWAIEGNWTPHILDSDSHRVRAGCRSSKDCPFRIRVNYNEKRRNALVTTCDDVHNCHSSRGTGVVVHQNIKRAETGKLRFLMEAVPKLMRVTLATNVQDIIDAVERKHGQRIPTRQAQKVKSGLAPRTRVPCEHCQKVTHDKSHCPNVHAITNESPVTVNDAVHDVVDMTGADELDHSIIYTDTTHQHHLDNAECSTEVEVGHDAQNIPLQPARRGRPRGQQSLPPIDPKLNSINQTGRFVQQPYTDHGDSQVLHARPLPDQIASPAPIPSKSPAEVRLEAAKLMQSAAVLMEQAAKMHAEAARLNLSVAHV